jgi:hypothetical protein
VLPLKKKKRKKKKYKVMSPGAHLDMGGKRTVVLGWTPKAGPQG